VGRDPFDGATLEWATTSPPPPYNFAVIPTVSSPYPMWDVRDREHDLQRAERGELVLAEGHQTPATSVVDGELDEVLDMPSDSPWPIALAGMLGLVTVFLLTGHWTTAVVFAGAGAVIVAAWHWTEADAERVAPVRRAAPNGWWGMAIFLSTEIALFGSVIGTYFYLRFTSPQWPQGGIPAPSVLAPVVLAAVLVASCAPMAAAARRGSWRLVAVALVIQAGYLAAQVVSYVHDLGDFSPSTNAYGSVYFTLLGAHHAHVAVGLLLDLWLLVRLAGGRTHYRLTGLRAVALYWYAVAAIGVLVVATQVSAS
jgi:heme/copper-type cytochrome/quinol oxidase subunit 3